MDLICPTFPSPSLLEVENWGETDNLEKFTHFELRRTIIIKITAFRRHIVLGESLGHLMQIIGLINVVVVVVVACFKAYL